MKVSLIYPSHRLGGIDLLAAWLGRQEPAIDYELIVVDGNPVRARCGRVAPYLRKAGVNVTWCGEPKQRTFPQSSIGYANAVNTGLMRAEGTHFVVIHDFMVVPAPSLELWAEAFRDDGLTCGTRSWCDSALGNQGVDECKTWEGPSEIVPSAREAASGFDTGFWGGPIALMEDCNGLDERSDFCHGWALADLKAKASILNWKLRQSPSITYHAIDHSRWGMGPLLDPYTVYHSTGMPDVRYEFRWTGWSANPFQLRGKRRKRG